MPTPGVPKGIGAVIVAVGAWVAVVAYVGPLFGYPMPPGSDQPAWEWSASHTWRHLLPGIVAIVGGAMLWARSRTAVAAGAGLALVAGIWMIISPFVVRAWLDTGGGGGSTDASTVMQIITPLGYHHAPGIITVALSALALGALATARTLERPEAPERETARRREAEREETEAERSEPVGASSRNGGDR